jgi:hypothetical protein
MSLGWASVGVNSPQAVWMLRATSPVLIRTRSSRRCIPSHAEEYPSVAPLRATDPPGGAKPMPVGKIFSTGFYLKRLQSA